MCGVIFGEWRGEDPADRDMPKITDKRKSTHYFQERACLRGAQHPERSALVSSVAHVAPYTGGNSQTC